MTDKCLLIIAHAPSPNTLRLRDALAEGTRHSDIIGITVKSMSPFDAGAADVLAAQAIILGTTENLGYMSGALKDFFDRIYYPCLEQTQGLPYALVIRAGHDGTGTRRAVETIVAGLRWRAVQAPLILRGEFREEFVEQCAELGDVGGRGAGSGDFLERRSGGTCPKPSAILAPLSHFMLRFSWVPRNAGQCENRAANRLTQRSEQRPGSAKRRLRTRAAKRYRSTPFR